MNKYQRNIKGETMDVYDILTAFNVTCPAVAHAVKKLLMPGKRGNKDYMTDLLEARQAINRAIELEDMRLMSYNVMPPVAPAEREPCPYCSGGKRTGLPGNACENCMNTGLANPTALDLAAID